MLEINFLFLLLFRALRGLHKLVEEDLEARFQLVLGQLESFDFILLASALEAGGVIATLASSFAVTTTNTFVVRSYGVLFLHVDLLTVASVVTSIIAAAVVVATVVAAFTSVATVVVVPVLLAVLVHLLLLLDHLGLDLLLRLHVLILLLEL